MILYVSFSFLILDLEKQICVTCPKLLETWTWNNSPVCLFFFLPGWRSLQDTSLMVLSATNIKQNAPGSLRASKYFKSPGSACMVQINCVVMTDKCSRSSSGRRHASVVCAADCQALSVCYCLRVQALLSCGFAAAAVRERHFSPLYHNYCVDGAVRQY